MSALGSLIVKLALEYAEYSKGLDKGEQEALAFAKKTQGHVDNLVSGVRDAVGNAAAMLAGAFAMGSVVGGVRDAIAAMAELDRASQQVGMSTENLAGWRLAASQVGTDFEGVLGAMSSLAEKASAQDEVFKKLGMSVTDGSGRIKDLDTLVGDLADRFAAAEDGTTKLAMAQELMGDDGMRLIPILNQGRDGIAALTTKAKEMGLAVSGDVARAATQFEGTLGTLQAGLDGVYTQVAAKSLPALQTVSEAFLRAAASEGATSTASDVLTGALKVVASGALIVGGVFEATGKLAGALAWGVVEMAGGVKDAFADIVSSAVMSVANLGSAAAKAVKGDFAGAAADARAAWNGFSVDVDGAADRVRAGASAVSDGAAQFAGVGKRVAGAVEEIFNGTGAGVAALTGNVGKGKKQIADLSDAASEATDEMKGLLNEWATKISQSNRAAASVVELSQTEQAYADLQITLAQNTSKMSKAQKEQVLQYAAVAVEIDRANQAQIVARKLSAEAIDAGLKSTEEIKKQVEEEVKRGQTIGLTSEQIVRLEAQTLNLEAAEKERYAAALEAASFYGGEYADTYLRLAELAREEAAAKRELAGVKIQNDDRQAAFDAAKSVSDAWKTAGDEIRDTLSDSVISGLESGKFAADDLAGYLKSIFSKLILKPVIDAGINSIFGGGGTGLPSIPGLGGFGGAGGGAGSSGGLSLSSLGDIKSLFGGGSGGGASLMSTAGAYLGGIQFGRSVGQTISGGYSAMGGSGNTAVNAGAIIGAALGGPLGGALGGAIGGLVNRAFGRGDKEVQSAGIQGTFNASGGASNLQTFSNWHQDGGWFRSDKSGTDYGAVSDDVKGVIDEQLGAVVNNLKSSIDALGGWSYESIDSFSQDIKITLGKSEEENSAAIAAAVSGWSNSMISTIDGISDRLALFQREGEDQISALTRMGDSYRLVSEALGIVGNDIGAIREKIGGGLWGGANASDLVDQFGGADAFTSIVSSAYDVLVPESERASYSLGKINEVLLDLIGVVPGSVEQYRAQIDALDLTTEAGRQQYAQLMALAPEWVQLNESVGAYSDAVKESAQSLRDALDEYSSVGSSSPESTLASIEKQFSEAVAGVNFASGGDELATAGERVQALIKPYLDAALEYYGTGEQYQKIKQNVLSSGEMVADFMDGGGGSVVQQAAPMVTIDRAPAQVSSRAAVELSNSNASSSDVAAMREQVKQQDEQIKLMRQQIALLTQLVEKSSENSRQVVSAVRSLERNLGRVASAVKLGVA